MEGRSIFFHYLDACGNNRTCSVSASLVVLIFDVSNLIQLNHPDFRTPQQEMFFFTQDPGGVIYDVLCITRHEIGYSTYTTHGEQNKTQTSAYQ